MKRISLHLSGTKGIALHLSYIFVGSDAFNEILQSTNNGEELD